MSTFSHRKRPLDGPIPEVEGLMLEVDKFRAQARHVDANRLLELLDILTGLSQNFVNIFSSEYLQ